jgi:hypothetical protein
MSFIFCVTIQPFQMNDILLMITATEGERNIWSFFQHVASICFGELLDILNRRARSSSSGLRTTNLYNLAPRRNESFKAGEAPLD